MNKKIAVIVLVILLALVLVVPASAITFGQPDGDQHPNVGVMIVQAKNGNYYLFCSGTLIAPDVFLTASHCTAPVASFALDPEVVYVSFDSVIDENATLLPGKPYVNPNFGHNMGDLHDVAVIVLDVPVSGITPARLPTAGLLDELKADKQLKNQKFVTVGYGVLRDDKTGGWHSIYDTNERHFADQYFLALKPAWLQISMNISTGSGGTCYGDSGGPHFLGDTDIVASITVTGDRWCRATDVTYRMDTESARSFLGQFVDLP